MKFRITSPDHTVVREVSQLNEIFTMIGGDEIIDGSVVNTKTQTFATPIDTTATCELRTHYFMHYALTRPIA